MLLLGVCGDCVHRNASEVHISVGTQNTCFQPYGSLIMPFSIALSSKVTPVIHHVEVGMNGLLKLNEM